MNHQLASLVVTGDSDRWREAGFAVDDDEIRIGSTAISIIDDLDRVGILAARVAGTDGPVTEPDGLPLHAADQAAPPPAVAPAHPNRVTAIDHVVAMTPDLDRTAAALDGFGLDLRRRRDAERDGHEVHQLFYWLGDVILEVVQDARLDADAPAAFWGLALTVDDLDGTAASLGPLVGAPRPAVQPGRRIASLKRDAGLSVPIAFMTPHGSAD